MPGFTRQITHTLTQEDAVGRLKGFVTGVEQKYGDLASEVSGEWAENMLHFKVVAMGFRIQGKLLVEAFIANIEVQYPFTAALFAGRIEETITRELKQALA